LQTAAIELSGANLGEDFAARRIKAYG